MTLAPMLFRRSILALLCLLPMAALAAGTATPAPPQPFTATYQVLRKGSTLGTSTLRLTHNADGTWTFRSTLDAKSGLAAMLGGHVEETSRFRWHAGHLEALRYDYTMHVGFKDRERHVTVNWPAGTVSVRGHDGQFHYATQPGLVERHLLVLALGRALAAGQQQMTVPVAVKDRVESQTFVARGTASVSVPAGTFRATRVDRTHDKKGYSVWYVPARFGAAPVKLVQASGGDITLLLKTFKR